MKTDVLFIHPGNQKRIYQDLSKEYTAIATPVWTTLIADRCRKNGHSVAIYDVNVDGWGEEVPAELMEKYNPELIVMMVYGHTPSASTQTMPAARMITNDLKAYNKDIPIALGGIHPSSLPERTMNEEAADFVMTGEGPYTVDGLIECIKGQKSRGDVPGLWYRKGSELISTPTPPVIADLDAELGDYAWDLLPDLSNYRAHNMHCFQDFEKSQTDDFSDIRSPYVAMNTSLGCPFNCYYCCINAIFGKPGIRYWSLEKVMTWMDRLAEQGVRNIRFDDELFILSPDRVERFCDMLIERGHNFNFWVYGRVDTVKQKLLKKLKQAGFNWICLGIEAGNEKVRNDVNKKIKTDIKDVVKQIQDEGIYVLGNYMFGLPEDTMDTMEETLQLAMELNCEFPNFYSVMALPGSKLYDWASENDSLPDSWAGFSQHSFDCKPLPTNYQSAAEVLKFRDEGFDRAFAEPRYLDMVKKTFGPKTLAHIEKMLKVKIKRKLYAADTK